MTDADRLDFVAGQVHGLKTIIAALIPISSNREYARQEIAKASLAATGRTGSTSVSDEFLAGLQDVLETFSKN